MSDWIPSPANALILLAALTLAYIFISKIKAKGAFLCEDCRFNREDLCLKAERPHATQCTSYREGPVVALQGNSNDCAPSKETVVAPAGTTTDEISKETESNSESKLN